MIDPPLAVVRISKAEAMNQDVSSRKSSGCKDGV